MPKHIDEHLKELKEKREQKIEGKPLEWYQRSRPAQGVRTKEGDRSDWSGSSARGQNWSGGRER
jgi:hypothetical protein